MGNLMKKFHSSDAHSAIAGSDAEMTVQTLNGSTNMLAHAMLSLPLAAIGYSLAYLLLGGGVVGAGVIFVVAKVLRK